MTKVECGICGGLIKEIDDGKDIVEQSYDGCEEDNYDEERR